MNTFARPMLCLFIATVTFGMCATSAPAAPKPAELRQQHPDLNQALVALGEENFEKAIPALVKLQGSEDAALAAEATFSLARAYAMQENLEKARPLFDKVAIEMADDTTRAGEALYRRGMCEAGLLDHHQATDTLDTFLDRFPDAPDHMREKAEKKLASLRRLEEGSLTDAQRRMDFSRRRLALEDTGDITQVEQDRIIEILTQLIGEDDQDPNQQPNCPNCQGGT